MMWNRRWQRPKLEVIRRNWMRNEEDRAELEAQEAAAAEMKQAQPDRAEEIKRMVFKFGMSAFQVRESFAKLQCSAEEQEAAERVACYFETQKEVSVASGAIN
jgi:hypothetical protein